jgi:hypothetical protein
VAHMQQDFFLICGYHSAHYAQTVSGNSADIPWAKSKRRKLRSAVLVQTGLDPMVCVLRRWPRSSTRIKITPTSQASSEEVKADTVLIS